MADHIRWRTGTEVLPAGERIQSYDLEVKGHNTYLRPYGLTAGKYEVKSLWRAGDTRSFDRRFKVGRRGETIYGKRDAQLKSFALRLEAEVDTILEHVVGEGRKTDRPLRELVEEVHSIVDLVLQRKHSKALLERLKRLAMASLTIPTMTVHAKPVVDGGVQPLDIVRGFSDLAGLFIVAGPSYTLLTGAEIPMLLTFDSASSEGPKLRYLGEIPGEPKKRERSKTKTAKGKKKQ